MATVGEHFHELLTRIENALKSLIEHDIPEVTAAATDAAEAVATLRGAEVPNTALFRPISEAALDAARIQAPSTVTPPVASTQA
jgi:hypothetical protein